MKGTTQGGGEIVQVDGGHIFRATGRKDRHSKVYTSKGPRDRRVRLSAHTAIQFYDVQDRLGYDRPSKAVDWLIKKAKTAIDKLNELPPQWQHGGCSHTPTPDSNPSSSDLALDHQSEGVCGYEIIHSNNNNDNNNSNNNNSSFGEADVMNTMKSLFPTSSFAGFANDPSCHSSSFQAEDLGLSLQTVNQGNSSNLPFQESFQRLDGWNGGGGADHMESRVGLLFNSLGTSQHAIFSQFAHRELLQSNAAAVNNPWNQRPLILANHDDVHHPRSAKSSPTPFELGFHVPARIYGEEEGENHR
ncbi:hypothetical protein C2S52_011885 [Perilla frutescens var. hirtella]|uniref:TCP domain-containing protein n=1 Tax=Perilla frutescens var. hirtella TaxID=608512 RepID=A0AAD4JHE2_PERFH|nr:hypothetical protein C2S52_011885 [Perilla frutescens var. hirtella]KAH6785501.1 hypothetical protein C2S51_037956 [Perilla frutescens var. frutescens]KAH6833893.1 hypothetical protein C2S53_004875 [Perilla frutescens var. hirtella]